MNFQGLSSWWFIPEASSIPTGRQSVAIWHTWRAGNSGFGHCQGPSLLRFKTKITEGQRSMNQHSLVYMGWVGGGFWAGGGN